MRTNSPHSGGRNNQGSIHRLIRFLQRSEGGKGHNSHSRAKEPAPVFVHKYICRPSELDRYTAPRFVTNTNCFTVHFASRFKNLTPPFITPKVQLHTGSSPVIKRCTFQYLRSVSHTRDKAQLSGCCMCEMVLQRPVNTKFLFFLPNET